MAVEIINNQQQQDEQKKKQQQGNLAATPQVGAQPVSKMAGGAAGPSSTGRFTNIQRVLGANVGNKLGQTVQSGITGMGQGIGQNVQQAKQQTLGQVQQSSAPFSNRAGVITDVNAAINAAQTGGMRQVGGQQIAGDEGMEKRVGELRQAQYGGPRELSSDDQLKLQGSIDAYRNMLQSGAKSPQNLLQRFVGGQGYTSGQQALDKLLMGRGPNLAGVQRQGLATQKELTGAERDIGQAAKEAEDAAAFARYYVTGEGKPFAGGSADIGSKAHALQTRAEGALAEDAKTQAIREDVYNQFRQGAISQDPNATKAAIAKGIQSGLFSPDETNEMMSKFYELTGGQSRRARTDVEGLNQGNYYRTGLYSEIGPMMERQQSQLGALDIQAAKNATLPQAMTSEEIARQNALNRLLGKDQTQLDTTLGGQFETGKLAFADPFKQQVAQKWIESQNLLGQDPGWGGSYDPNRFKIREESMGGAGYIYSPQAVGVGTPNFGQLTSTATTTERQDPSTGYSYGFDTTWTPNYALRQGSDWVSELSPQQKQYQDTVRDYNTLLAKYAPMAYGISSQNQFGSAPSDMNAYIQQKMSASPEAARWQQLRSTLQGMGA